MIARRTPRPPAAPHAPFLERIASQHAESQAETGLAMGAYLVLRLVDQLGKTTSSAALRYQLRAVRRHLHELRGTWRRSQVELNHLESITATVESATRRRRVNLVLPALLGYAFYLERDMRLAEALDVVRSADEIGADSLSDADVISLCLTMGRLNKLLSLFDDADVAYERARQAADRRGDRHSVLISRLGRAGIIWRRGNLGDAEVELRTLVADAEAEGDMDAAARGEHDLAIALYLQKRYAEAIPHGYRAHELYLDPQLRLNILHDIGMMLKDMGDYRAASHAFAVRLRGLRELEPHGDVVAQHITMIELMDIAARTNDRLGFERYRARCLEVEERLPPEHRADFKLKEGQGLVRLGSPKRGRRRIHQAAELARSAGLHELAFRAERATSELDAGVVDTEPDDARRQQSAWQATRQVADALQDLMMAE